MNAIEESDGLFSGHRLEYEPTLLSQQSDDRPTDRTIVLDDQDDEGTRVVFGV